MDRPHRVVRPAITAVGVLLGRQIRFEDRIEHQQRRHLDRAVRDRGHPERAELHAVGLWQPDPLDRLRFVGLAPQPLRQFPKPAFLAIRLDVLEPLAVHPCCALVGLAAAVGIFQHVGPIHRP